MQDTRAMFDKQIREFLLEYKNRFTTIPPFMGMQGKQGYSAKINRQDVNSSLQVFIPESFPTQAPIFYVNPPFSHELIDQTGRVIDDCLLKWSIYSSLKNCVGEVLGKLESRAQLNSQQKIQLQGSFNQTPQMKIDDDKTLLTDLASDLNKKSLEELIYINFNPEHYVYQFTQSGRDANEKLLNEVKNLSMKYEEKKKDYDKIKEEIEQCKKKYDEKENELKQLYEEKKRIDGKVTVDNLINEMKKYIDENYSKPRQKIISEFMTKIIDFDTFKEKFKEVTLKYHYYSIIKDKLNLCK